VECCPRKLHSLATAWASHIVAVLTHFRLSPYPRPPSGRHCIAKSGQFGGETGATERGRLLRFLAGRPGELMGAIRGADTGRLRQYPRQTRAAGSGDHYRGYAAPSAPFAAQHDLRSRTRPVGVALLTIGRPHLSIASSSTCSRLAAG